MTRTVAPLLVASALVAGPLAQEAVPQFSSRVQLVEVYATVTDAKGEPVTGLRQADFEVLEDGTPQEVSAFAAGEFPLVLNTYIHNAEDAKRKGAPVDWVAQDPVFTKFQPIGVGAKAPHPNAAKLFVDYMLSEEGQRIIASFGRVPTRRAVPTNVQGLDKLNFVIDEFSAGDDFNKSYEQFRNVFGTPKQ